MHLKFKGMTLSSCFPNGGLELYSVSHLHKEYALTPNPSPRKGEEL
jgi:hypothetical protein